MKQKCGKRRNLLKEQNMDSPRQKYPSVRSGLNLVTVQNFVLIILYSIIIKITFLYYLFNFQAEFMNGVYPYQNSENTWKSLYNCSYWFVLLADSELYWESWEDRWKSGEVSCKLLFRGAKSILSKVCMTVLLAWDHFCIFPSLTVSFCFRFEKEFSQHTASLLTSDLLDCCLWVEYQITYINSFSSLK